MPSMQESTKAKICAALFLLGEGVSVKKLLELINENVIINAEAIQELNTELSKFGLQIINSNEQIQITTTSEVSEVVKAIKLDEVSNDLTPAALQVMTIITYLDGPSKSDISYIRGAQSGASIRNLSTRGLIYKKEEKLYPTTEALQHLGVKGVEDLPEYAKLNAEFNEKLGSALQDEK